MLRLLANPGNRKFSGRYGDSEAAPRSELFSIDQMEQHGKTLAGWHNLTDVRKQDLLLDRLATNEEVLTETYNMLTATLKNNRAIPPAGEWLLDNFYLIEEQILTARNHLPKGYSRELPRLLDGPSAGLPRVYDIALETISHGDGRVQPESLSRFVTAYQTVSELKIGELWAIPIMLRLALIEGLRRVAASISAACLVRDLADEWANRMLETAEQDPKSLILVIADMARSNPPLVSSFVAELARLLQGHGPSLALPLTWIEQRLLESGRTIEQLVRSEVQQQASNQVSISNIIGSLRMLGATDWRDFVEKHSVVEAILSEDPGGVYSGMEFTTRNRYRHVIERMAKKTSLSEGQLARAAITLAQDNARTHPIEHRGSHVGFYLIDKGLPLLKKSAQVRASIFENWKGTILRHPLALYLGTIMALSAVFTAGLLSMIRADDLPHWLHMLVGITCLIAVSQLAIALTNWVAMLLAAPQALPRMDFSKGISSQARALVVVPTILTSAQNVEDLLEGLEVRFLGNRDSNLYFGLLTDFRDANQKVMPGDSLLLKNVDEGIKALNEKYREEGNDIFFLFHRPRVWNSRDQIWMGYERKRGKLAALNALLQCGQGDDFSLISGDTEVLDGVRYVITLDTDTQLPRDAARQFIGAMEHPLNRPRYDVEKKLVVEGYGILQPRVAISLPSAKRSLYARLYASDSGIDPYTRAVSDLYQDLFHEGSFIGKGIYDVEAFEFTLKERFPENRILSHDLLEGCYARSGLLSDVQLYEESPPSYQAHATRTYRWIRGDWQLLSWLFADIPVPQGLSERNPLSALSQWKLFDNLRRSLIPVSLMCLLLMGWTILSPRWTWTLVVISILFIPPLISSIFEVFRKPKEGALDAVFNSTLVHIAQASLTLTCLAYEAWSNLQAVAVTLWRMMVTGKDLLSWSASANVDRQMETGIVASYRTMWSAPSIAIIAFIIVVVYRPDSLLLALPLLGLWVASPAVVWWLSRSVPRRTGELSVEQNDFLRRAARKTWAFFDTLVGPNDNWLPPDNYQERPVDRIAHRTSPTNIGLALLANLSAYEFGYIVQGQLVERTANTLKTMESLERHRGHFYNWYDTETLQPLLPTYVSTVDSGNLAAHLLTLRRGLVVLPDELIIGGQFFAGLKDTVSLIFTTPGASDSVKYEQLKNDIDIACESRFTTLSDLRSCLETLANSAAGMCGELSGIKDPDAVYWAKQLAGQCVSALEEVTFFAPWTSNGNSSGVSEDKSALSTMTLPVVSDTATLDDRLVAWTKTVDQLTTLRSLADLEESLAPEFTSSKDCDAAPETEEWLSTIKAMVALASARANERIAEIDRLVRQSGEMADMDYDFLFDKSRHLLSIGYNVSERRLDASYYDLLASEARIASFVGIAQGQLPQESWFALGRLRASTGGDPILFSWSGSMFEYLMPLLVMPTYQDTILDQTYRAAVSRQIEYGKQRGVPWGISESGYSAVDVQLNYQYRAFGVPGLGLKRGLAEDLVVAPYASMLALMVSPDEACLNLERLAAMNCLGKFGFYEAIDYTPARVPHGQPFTIVQSFMSHHQGMSLLALAYTLLNRPMQRLFESEPAFQSTMLLLQERIPKSTVLHTQSAEVSGLSTTSGQQAPVRFFTSPDATVPEVQLLSNGRYHVMVTSAGGGYSCWNDLAVTRFREDAIMDNCGMFCYIRDLTSSEFWSPAFQPTLKTTDSYEAIFSDSRVEFRRRGFDCDMHSEIVVSSEDDIELRRVRITNRARAHRTIDVTSYAEVVLAPNIADALHPAFSKLFVQTEIIRDKQAILCNRRPRSSEEKTPWMFHLMAAHGATIEEISHETDRSRFIGRGNSLVQPEAMMKPGPLSGTDGSVLDPIVSIRCHLTLEPEASATIDIVTGMAETREECLSFIEKYHDRSLADRVFDLAWTHSQVVLRQINATDSDAQLYGRLAGSVIYANNSMRADTSTIVKNRRGQSGLWGYAVSGDLPIVLLQIDDQSNIDLVRQLIQAHAYWRLKGLAVDLVIWNEDRAGYRQLLQDQIMGLIAASSEANVFDRPGGIFVRPAEQISTEDRILFQSVARVVITDKRGTLAEQLARRIRDPRVPRLVPSKTARSTPVAECPWRELILFNGLGGFTPDGREYVITTASGESTPAPWVNVMANPIFGSVISENGSSYTWYENAHEFRLTPWYNDPICDTTGEVFYLRDEDSGRFWSPSPLPSRGEDSYYISRHGFGYSVFEHTESGIVSELSVYVAKDDPVKISVLKIRNASGRARRLSATAYVEWVLGDMRSRSAMHVTTEIDTKSDALFAHNRYNSEFANLVAFLDVDDPNRTVTGDRSEFIGRNGTLRNPAALGNARLSGRVGAALDPCGAMQVAFDLADGQEREIIFRLGVGRDANDATNLVHRFRGSGARRDSFEALCQYWKHTLGAVNVDTPDPSVNMLVNGWLMYQTIACRLWARSGFYQSGGAFGFRDQLQDIMALVHAEPRLMREHLLRCAEHQFQEGDVQHWWHPPLGRGVRTHCSDDFLWLPLATHRYVMTTGDTGVLDEPVHFLSGRPVNPEDESYYDLPARSEEVRTLYEHCVRAISRGLTSGAHGLPLIGSCDWNDGMNLVGKDGKGESVWLAFFLCNVLSSFTEIAQLRGDGDFVQRCQKELAEMKASIEKNGWDGQWYRRAYFDDGQPLGSVSNDECKIDAIAQSWSVLSAMGDPLRARQAMEAVDEHLVDREHELIRLLDPPFDKSELNPGYIKGYVPGVRENGGQYTHGAIWTVMAFAALGDNKRAWELFQLINPVMHANCPEGVATYKVEPYVVAADVYAAPPHTGRGGWTWYTGSSGWMYRLIVESLLGLRLQINKLSFVPCLPEHWETFKIHYRHRETVYHITIFQTKGKKTSTTIKVDGQEQNHSHVNLIDDRNEHFVEVHFTQI